MEIFCFVVMVFGLIFLILAAGLSDNKAVALLIFIGVILILASSDITKTADRGKPAPSLKVLIAGEKYEVVASYNKKYIIVKSATDDGLKFIGPLDFGTVTTGRYVKTAEESLVKIEW